MNPTLSVFVLIALFFAFTGAPAFAQSGEAVLSATQASRLEQQDLDFADGLYQRGMYESAARHYQDFLDKHPQSPSRETALFRLAESLYQRGAALWEDDPVAGNVSFVEARAAFMRLLEAFPQGEKRYDARLRLGEIGYKIGDAEGGLAELERVIEASPSPALVESALFYAARCFDRLGERGKAEAYYRRLRQDHPGGAFAGFGTYLLGELLSKQDRLDEAIAALNHLWQNPRQYGLEQKDGLIGDAQLLAAQLLYRMERYGEAASAYRSFADANPEGAQTARAKYGAAWAEYQQGRYADALATAQTLKQQFLPADMIAGILFLQGACSYQEEDYDSAIRYFRETIADPNAGDYRDRAWYQLAWSYYLSGDYEQTAVECRNLLRMGAPIETAAKVRFILGQAYAKLQNLRDAIEELKQVELTDPNCEFNQDALYLRADLLYRAERFSEAGAAFERYFNDYEDSPRALQALLWAANARFSAKEYARAVELVDALIEAAPQVDDLNGLLYRKSLALYHLKRFDDALLTLSRLLESPRGDDHKPEALYWQAYIYEMKENPSKASQLYGQLLDRFPDFATRDEARLRKAVCDYQTERFSDAYAGFYDVLQSPKRDEVPIEIGFWCIVHADEEGYHDEALELAETLLALHASDEVQERALIAKGNQQVALERWPAAQQTTEAFLERFPDSLFKPEIHWVMAKALEGQGQNDKAAALYRESLLQLQDLANPDPDFEAKLYVDMGRVLAGEGANQDALDAFLRVAILFDHPRLTPEAMYRAVGIHLKLDQRAEAATLFDELAENYPKSEWSARARGDYAALAGADRP